MPAVMFSLFWNVGLATVLAVIVGVLCRLRPFQHRPAFVHTLWLLVLVKLVTPPLIPVPMLGHAEPKTLLVAERENPADSRRQATPLAEPRVPLVEPDHREIGPANHEPLEPLETQAAVAAPVFFQETPWLLLLAGVSLCGTSILASVCVSRFWRVSRLVRRATYNDARLGKLATIAAERMGLRAGPRVCAVEAPIVPFLWVWFGGPVVVLPTKLVEPMSDDQVTCILCHELAHFARKDHWANWFAFVVAILFWWLPVAWWVWRQMRAAQEVCCDGLVLEAKPADRRCYAEALFQALEFVQNCQPLRPNVAVGFGDSSSLRRRFQMIATLHVKPQVSWFAVMLAVVSVAAMLCIPVRGEPPAATQGRSASEEKQVPAPPKPPANTDLERMAGLWTIVNGNDVHRDDGLGSKGQVWDIGKHQIVPDPFLTGVRTRDYFHRLDSGQRPKQIDITVTAASSPGGTEIPIKADARILGVIKGIYVLDGDELRLSLGEMGKDRPAAFPAKPKPGEVLVLQRASSGVTPPAAKGAEPERKVLTSEEAIQQMPKENVTVQFKVAAVELDLSYLYTGIGGVPYLYLKDGGGFTAVLICRESFPGDQLKKLGFETYEDFQGKMVRVTGRVESLNMKNASPKGMFVRSASHMEVVQPKTDGNEQKPSEQKPDQKPEQKPNEEQQPVPKGPIGAEQPQAKGGPPDAKKVLTPEEAIKLMPKENVTVQFKVASVHRPNPNYRGYFINYVQLRDGDKFVANLFDKALAVGQSEDLTGKMVRVTGRVEPVGDALFRMVVRDANNIEVVKASLSGDKEKKADEKKPAAKEPKVLPPEEAVKLMPKENVTVQFKVASVEVTGFYTGFPATYYVHLKDDGGKFTAWLNAYSGFNEDQVPKLEKKLGIESVKDLSGKVVRVTGRIDESGLRMWVHDVANNVEVVKPKAGGNEQKPSEQKPEQKPNEEQQPVPKGPIGAEQPKAKGGPPDAKKVLTPAEVIKQMPKENVTVQFKVASVGFDGPYSGFPVTYYICLEDGGKFTARLIDNAFTPLDVHLKRLGIKTFQDFKGKVVRVTGRVETDPDKSLFLMWVRDHADVEIVKASPSGDKEKQPDEKKPAAKERKVLTPEEAIQLMPKEIVTGQFKVASVRVSPAASDANKYSPVPLPSIILMDGGQFAVSLTTPVRKAILRPDIDPVKHFSGKVVRVTGLVQHRPGESSFYILVTDLNQFALVGE